MRAVRYPLHIRAFKFEACACAQVDLNTIGTAWAADRRWATQRALLAALDMWRTACTLPWGRLRARLFAGVLHGTRPSTVVSVRAGALLDQLLYVEAIACMPRNLRALHDAALAAMGGVEAEMQIVVVSAVRKGLVRFAHGFCA